MLLCFSCFESQAQEVLTLEQAINIALERNYDIRLVSNDVEISKNNVSRANAGMLPRVTGDFSTNTTISNTTQTQSSGLEVTRKGAKNSNLNYGPSLNWTIFDGFGMFTTYDRLKELQNLGEANLKTTVLSTVFTVVNTYYEIMRQQKSLVSSKTAVELSRLRLNTAQNRYEIGKAAKLEVLAATVDLNTDTTTYLRQIDLIKNTKIQLNTLLARDVNTDFSVSDNLSIDSTLNIQKLTEAGSQQNPALQSALINQRIAELNLKQVKSLRYPVVGINTGYNFSKSESELGFARQSNGRGFNYGLTASVNIFNGFLQKKNERNAAIEIESARLDYSRISESIQSQLASAYQTYLTSLHLVSLEESNLNVAKQNLDITLEKFRLGSIAPLEFREAQRNYVDASVRLNNAQYDAKLAEVLLKELSGTLNVR
ncbi:MAG: TolC family protein [Sphingobacteriaceae bacterium]|nr:TolC family protein [Sphingobacteriaceae bacterium]